MALRGRGFMSVGAAVACCALAAACTSEPAPSSTPSPSPAATTPTESQIERQMRLDYEAAETAYRGNIGRAGRGYTKLAVPTKATPAMRATATGSYLRITLESLRRIKKAGLACDRQRPRSSAWLQDGGWRESRVGLTSCEDNSVVQVR